MSSTTSKSSEPRAAAAGMAQPKHPDDLGRCTACREVYEERLLQGGKCCLCQKPTQWVAQRTTAECFCCTNSGYVGDELFTLPDGRHYCGCKGYQQGGEAAKHDPYVTANGQVRECRTADTAVLALQQAMRLVRLALTNPALPADAASLAAADGHELALRRWAETLGEQPSSKPAPVPVPMEQALVVQTARCSPVDYSGMPRAMLESLCQTSGIRYPLGASRARLASLLSAK